RIWEKFLNRDYPKVNKILSWCQNNDNPYKCTYISLQKIIFDNFYDLPLVVSVNTDLIEQTMNNPPGRWNEHAIFVKSNKEKNITGSIRLHTNVDEPFYSGYSQDLGTFYEDQFDNGLEDMIQYLIDSGYKA